jgi:hypothetical protein
MPAGRAPARQLSHRGCVECGLDPRSGWTTATLRSPARKAAKRCLLFTSTAWECPSNIRSTTDAGFTRYFRLSGLVS